MSLFQRWIFHSSVKLLQLNMEKKGIAGHFQDFIAFFFYVCVPAK